MSEGRKDPHTIKMMLMTLAAVCGTVAVILTAFLFLNRNRAEQLQKESTEQGAAVLSDGGKEKPGASAKAVDGTKEAQAAAGDSQQQEGEGVQLIEGDPTSPNPYERVSRLSYTDTIQYQQEDLAMLDADGLMITRAEILGRHGRIFNDQNLQNYFEGQSWYSARYTAAEFDEGCLNEVERYNMELLLAAEKTF